MPGGDWRRSAVPATIDVFNPATGEAIHAAGGRDVSLALVAAQRAARMEA